MAIRATSRPGATGTVTAPIAGTGRPSWPLSGKSGRNQSRVVSVYGCMNVVRGGLKVSAAAVLLCAVLAGCGKAASATAPEVSNAPSQTDVVLSADPADEREHPAAIVSGLLTLQDGCLALAGSPTLWPAGSVWDEEEMTVVLLDGSRLQVGDRVEVGGGLVSPSVASNCSASAQQAIDACVRSLGSQEMALISGTSGP
jgi:hypothetical protein